MSKTSELLYNTRRRPTDVQRGSDLEEFESDKSRIIFCSSFRRMMQKAQVFSLEANTSVRNRLTHSLEVADIGKTLANHVGKQLEKKGLADSADVMAIKSVVENACLIHDIGNPPFGHFGEEAIKKWFSTHAIEYYKKYHKQEQQGTVISDKRFNDFLHFDGNPQGFRITTKLHTEYDEYSLNLTHSTLLASIKYPTFDIVTKDIPFFKKLGIFSSEKAAYEELCKSCGHTAGKRYFLVYLMELADDICYCLSDIADAFEKRIIDSRHFKEEFGKLCSAKGIDFYGYFPKIKKPPIVNFSKEIAIVASRLAIKEASQYFSDNFETYIVGEGEELIEMISCGKLFDALKEYARLFIYTSPEAQKIEIAGYRIVHELLDHYGKLLNVPQNDFSHFIREGNMRKGSGLDVEWRIFNQLSKRMVESYKKNLRRTPDNEWFTRCRLIVDYISGMTDQSALRYYHELAGIQLQS